MSTKSSTIGIRGDGLGSSSTEHPTFKGVIDLPYKLTAGKAAGTFLAELANEVILGSRAGDDGTVFVPAQDFDGRTGKATDQLVVVGESGVLSGFTETAEGVIGLIRLDGADTDMVHQVLDAKLGDLEIGQRVTARWADEAAGGMLDLAGFTVGGDAGDGAVQPYAGDTEPIQELKYGMRLEYDHSYGPYYGLMFDELATSRRIIGSRVPGTGKVLVPPRAVDEVTFEETGEFVDVQDTGVIKAFSVIHLEFVGQTREPPYVYAEIVLDGANTRLIHTVGGIDANDAPELLKVGMRVKAVWKDDVAPTGTLEDIDHFALIEGQV